MLLVIIAIVTFRLISSADPRTGEGNLSTESHPPSPLTDDSAEVQVSLPLFHRLNANYLRGALPARGGVAALKRLGVKTLVDLRSVYEWTDNIGVAAERYGLRYRHLPMSVWDPPTDEQAKEFLSLVADSSNGPYFVFCDDGMHRTGEMSAIYRIAYDGWSVEQALKEMDRVGFNPFYIALRNYVWTFARKYRPAAVPAGARRLSWLERQE